MKKVPSEWTPQEAWGACAKAYREHWDLSHYWALLPFPPDPVERASDETVEAYAACSSDSITKALAIEVLASRAKDKGEKA